MADNRIRDLGLDCIYSNSDMNEPMSNESTRHYFKIANILICDNKPLDILSNVCSSPGRRLVMTFSSSYQLFMKSINTTKNTHTHRRNTVNPLNSCHLCPSNMTLRSSRKNLWAQFIKAQQCNTNTKEQRNLIPQSILKSQNSVLPQIEYPYHLHSCQGLGPTTEGDQKGFNSQGFWRTKVKWCPLNMAGLVQP